MIIQMMNMKTDTITEIIMMCYNVTSFIAYNI